MGDGSGVKNPCSEIAIDVETSNVLTGSNLKVYMNGKLIPHVNQGAFIWSPMDEFSNTFWGEESSSHTACLRFLRAMKKLKLLETKEEINDAILDSRDFPYNARYFGMSSMQKQLIIKQQAEFFQNKERQKQKHSIFDSLQPAMKGRVYNNRK